MCSRRAAATCAVAEGAGGAVTVATGVQEYCNGGSLRAAVADGMFTAQTLPHRWEPVMGVLRGIAEGMAYVHSKRVCHGDLNPANVLLKACPHPPPPPCGLSMPLCASRVGSAATAVLQWNYVHIHTGVQFLHNFLRRSSAAAPHPVPTTP